MRLIPARSLRDFLTSGGGDHLKNITNSGGGGTVRPLIITRCVCVFECNYVFTVEYSGSANVHLRSVFDTLIMIVAAGHGQKQVAAICLPRDGCKLLIAQWLA